VTGHALIPDIIIGGGPRSGTTFLCNLLSKHPDPPFIPEPKVCTISQAIPAISNAIHALHGAMRKIGHEQKIIRRRSPRTIRLATKPRSGVEDIR
jgi:Sulfotransferase family